MFGDAEVAVGKFAMVLISVLIPTILALVACQMGGRSWFFFACACVPILFAVCSASLGTYGFFSNWLKFGDLKDFGLISFPVALSIPFFRAGFWSFSRLKQNSSRTSD